ncbi:unnamed protein product [Caenorhabditis bovis]|uniref:Uncharacterized protein n=1 Tax=Caenorhabditis bovis TaxID=2654633 RepID=A0A8S1EM10_9PELO|nr:unnamed protein product [Caenorhabditis bovis]
MDGWSSFVQINIFDRPLSEIEGNLKALLNNAGINHFTISEQQMYIGSTGQNQTHQAKSADSSNLRRNENVVSRPFERIVHVDQAFVSNPPPANQSSSSSRQVVVVEKTNSTNSNNANSNGKTIKKECNETFNFVDFFENQGYNIKHLFDTPSTSENGTNSTYFGYSEDDLNRVHTIKCQWPGCVQKYTWKIRYGKLRLMDHALTHCEQKKLPCHVCGFLTQNVRQMRGHYASKHPSQKPKGYGIRDIPISNDEMRMLWHKCFSNSIGILGEASNEAKFVRQIRPKKPKLAT